MSQQAQATAPGESSPAQHPLEDLTLQETLRVMDVAREMREDRQSAEGMFRVDDRRAKLREKLVRTARLSGDDVTEAEIDAAIGQYLDRLHVFEEPDPGLNSFMAHMWVWRHRVAMGLAATVAVAGGLWFLFA